MNTIPLRGGVNNTHQIFSQRLNGVLYGFEVFYVAYTDKPYWAINVLQDGMPFALGIPLNVDGDLLMNQNVGQFGQLLFIGEEPTLNNLGTANKLIWAPPL